MSENFSSLGAMAQPVSQTLGLFDTGSLAEAEQNCLRLLSEGLHDPQSLHALGRAALLAANNNQLARQLIEKAVELGPANAIWLNDLGKARRNLGQLAEAEALARQALALQPDFAEAHNTLGNVLRDLGRSADAGDCYRAAIRFDPKYPQAHSNLGNILGDLHRPAEAIEWYRRAVSLKPDFAAAYLNMGNACGVLEDLDAAATCYRKAISAQPEYADALNNLGSVLFRQRNFSSSEESLRKAIALRPDFPEAHYNLGHTMSAVGDRVAAERCFARAVSLRPNYVEALVFLYRVRRDLLLWTDIGRLEGLLRNAVALNSAGGVPPFTFLYVAGVSASEQLAYARRYGEQRYAYWLSLPPKHHRREAGNPQRLRVGYLSTDFHEHATSYLLAEVIELRDRSRFELFAYSCAVDDESPMRRRITTAFDIFRDVAKLTGVATAELIADDEIDILVDLKGYTENTRLQTIASRPSPITVSWLGYPGTLGVSRMADYLIGDPVVTPLDRAENYSETLALMPHCYQPNDRKRLIGAKPTRAEAGLPEQGLVLCSFNQAYKITPEVFDLWCRLLLAVPDSVLWLLDPGPVAAANLRVEAIARGVPDERIVFSPKLNQTEHLGRLQLADLALDTFPCTSHTTASDALWANVPLVTRIGETFASRVAASILQAAGLRELVTGTPEEYLNLLIELASQPGRLAEIKTRLKDNRLSCPLFDSARFANDLGRLYERIWEHHCAGRKEQIVLD